MNPTILFSELIHNHNFKSEWEEFVYQISSQHRHSYDPQLQTIEYEQGVYDNNKKILLFKDSLSEIIENRFKQTLIKFKSDVNEYVFDKIPQETKISYLKLTKKSLEELNIDCQSKLSEYSEMISKIINDAISFTENYLTQISEGLLYYSPPVQKLNWTANLNMLGKLIEELSEPHPDNGNTKRVEQSVYEMYDFFSEFFLLKGKPIKRDSLRRLTNPDKVSGSKITKRKRN